MLKNLLALSAIASLCSATLVPVSSYIGDHKYKCSYGSPITGARIDNTIYTFGGCYLIPYLVDPNADDYNTYSRGPRDHTNVSDTMQTYDLLGNQWTQETTVKTPYPWRMATTETYKQNIYFHNIETKDYYSFNTMTWWKYDTQTKIWSQLDRFPFIWHGRLLSCQCGDKIYFAGMDDSNFQRSIIQVFNVKDEMWEKPIFPDQDIYDIKKMLCNEKYIQFLGIKKDSKKNKMFYYGDNDGGPTYYDITSLDFSNGKTFVHGLNITTNRGSSDAVKGDSFYILNVESKNSTIFKLDTTTDQKTILGTLPFTLQKPLFIPFENDQIFLFGGGVKRRRYYRPAKDNEEVHVNTIKTYHHKLIPDNDDDSDVKFKLVLQE